MHLAYRPIARTSSANGAASTLRVPDTVAAAEERHGGEKPQLAVGQGIAFLQNAPVPEVVVLIQPRGEEK